MFVAHPDSDEGAEDIYVVLISPADGLGLQA
jgi:hypothetical protein